ncbi:MAG: hypothetical protein J0H68_03630 [Sphingobacteriia bacterium]|nr:hypothetical protein [Sphingobacteriia bacterium]
MRNLIIAAFIIAFACILSTYFEGLGAFIGLSIGQAKFDVNYLRNIKGIELLANMKDPKHLEKRFVESYSKQVGDATGGLGALIGGVIGYKVARAIIDPILPPENKKTMEVRI